LSPGVPRLDGRKVKQKQQTDLPSPGDTCAISTARTAYPQPRLYDGRSYGRGLACGLQSGVDMRAVLQYCVGELEVVVPSEAELIREGETTGHLYVLLEGHLEVLKGETVVATVTEPGAFLGEMSMLLNQPHTATGRAVKDSKVYKFNDATSLLRAQPAVAIEIAKLLAHRLNAATTYLADIKRQYAEHGNHLSMVGDVLESLVNLSPKRMSPGSNRQPDPRL
jgi:CRP/FNR family cyclic AMP-dependent transcriptional regulator